MTEDVLFEQGSDVSAESDVKSENEKQSSESVVEGRYRISPLTLTVFRRETGNGSVFRNFQLQRTYSKDDEGSEFGYTESLRPRDLRKAARLLELAADDVQGLRKESVGGER